MLASIFHLTFSLHCSSLTLAISSFSLSRSFIHLILSIFIQTLTNKISIVWNGKTRLEFSCKKAKREICFCITTKDNSSSWIVSNKYTIRNEYKFKRKHGLSHEFWLKFDRSCCEWDSVGTRIHLYMLYNTRRTMILSCCNTITSQFHIVVFSGRNLFKHEFYKNTSLKQSIQFKHKESFHTNVDSCKLHDAYQRNQSHWNLRISFVLFGTFDFINFFLSSIRIKTGKEWKDIIKLWSYTNSDQKIDLFQQSAENSPWTDI